MASSNSAGTGKFIALAVVVVIGSALGGYFLVGATHQPDAGNAVPIDQQTSSTPASPATTTSKPASSQNGGGDYTSPTAPRIEIHEEKMPVPHDVAKVAPSDNTPTQPDTEATQEASAPSPSSAPDTSSVGTVPSPVTGDATTPATSSQSSDPDYEQTANAPNTEAIPTNSGAPVAGRAQYRVQVGSFTQAMSARSLADVLRNRGYSTTTVTERGPDNTVYHVQAGAFRTRAAADRATVELQREGFPAFVSPISQ